MATRGKDESGKPADGKELAQASEPGSGNGRIFPTASPVSVPNVPKIPDESTPDEAALQSTPEVDNSIESNWSDNTKPMPRAKKARTSIL